MRITLTPEIIHRFQTKGTLVLGIAPSWSILQRIRILALNYEGVEVRFTTYRQTDTDFSYIVYTEKRLKKAQLEWVRAYIQGVIDSARAN